MVCSRCLKVIKQELQELGITVLSLELGKLLVEAPNLSKAQINQEVAQVLHANGFEIVKSEEDMLVDLMVDEKIVAIVVVILITIIVAL